MEIEKIEGREILDSRGNPTIEVEITLSDGTHGKAAVPSGASTGENEAIELRDRNDARFGGSGVLKAIDNIRREILPALKGLPIFRQRKIDETMILLDGTENKGRLGANAILGVSLAAAVTAANALHTPLFRYIGGVNTHRMPVPMMNIINGGRHSSAPIAFQEFMIRPVGAENIHEAVRMGCEIFARLKRIIRNRGFSIAVGDEGGFAPEFNSIEDALSTITVAIEEAGYTPGRQVTIALDCAASEFFRNGIYDYSLFEPKGTQRDAKAQTAFLTHLVENFPIDSIEDGMSENDWDGWRMLTEAIGDRCQLVGDDLFVTNRRFLQRGIKERCANSILIKPNQIGTLTETLDTIELARSHGYSTIISHRSGETEDTTIADLAVATNSGQIKTGSVTRGERTAKYNRLMRIENLLGKSATYGI